MLSQRAVGLGLALKDAVRRFADFIRAAVAVALLFAAPTVDAQALVRGYVNKARGSQRGAVENLRSAGRPAAQPRISRSALNRRLASKVRAHESEAQVVRSLGGGIKAVYTKSKLLPGQYDRFSLFKVDSLGRSRPISTRAVYMQMVRGLKYHEVVKLWTTTVSMVKAEAYATRPEVRIQVDAELRFLEKEIGKRAARSGKLDLPWREQIKDPVKELDKVGNGKKIADKLKNGTAAERGTLEMIRQGAYRIYTLRDLPIKEFAMLLRSGQRNGLRSVKDVRPTDIDKVRQKNSPLAKEIAKEIHGQHFGKLRSVLILDGSFQEKIGTIVHEFNHGANRIAGKAKFTDAEVLAFEMAAFASEEKLSRGELRELKKHIVREYGLNVDPALIPDSPRGNKGNWVPRFPKGQERGFQAAYFKPLVAP